jgi:hypothetical protein
MNVLLLSRYDRMGASSRIRSYQYLPSLQAAGVDVVVAPLLSNDYLRRSYAGQPTNWFAVVSCYFRRIAQLLSVRQFDLVWIEKELFPNLPAFFEHLMSRLRIPPADLMCSVHDRRAKSFKAAIPKDR